MNKTKYIAVAAGLGLIGYLFFSGPFMSLFKSRTQNQNNQMPQTGYVSQDLVAGQGNLAERGMKLTVHYVGSLPNGQIFDSSRDSNTPFTFVLGAGQVIRGWDEGIQGMREGGKRLLVIAPDYAYGDKGRGPIPANTTLIFEVELLKAEE